MPDLTPADIDRLLELEAKATPGPWVNPYGDIWGEVNKRPDVPLFRLAREERSWGRTLSYKEHKYNGEFILAARNLARPLAEQARRVPELEAEIARLRAMLRSAMCLVNGLGCPGCNAQGRRMAVPGRCCRDEDCDAGWYGIACDEVKSFLEAADALMPGTLAQIENPPAPVNDAALAKEPQA